MRLNLASPFAPVRESIEVEDPFGLGVVFLVRPSDHPAVAALFAAKVSGFEGPSRLALGRTSKEIAVRQVKGESLSSQQQTEIYMQQIQRALEETPDEAWADVVSAASDGLTADELAEHLVIGWRGLVDEDTNEECGEPLTDHPGYRYSRAVAVEVLSLTTLVPPGNQHAGETVGNALRSMLLAASQGAVKTVAALTESAEGNSASSSGSGPGTGTSSKTTSETPPSAS